MATFRKENYIYFSIFFVKTYFYQCQFLIFAWVEKLAWHPLVFHTFSHILSLRHSGFSCFKFYQLLLKCPGTKLSQFHQIIFTATGKEARISWSVLSLKDFSSQAYRMAR
jgi:hypothetical protein